MKQEYYGHPNSRIAFLACCDALNEFSENDEIVLDGREPDPIFFWPSTISRLDLNVGGFYGLTTVAADGGTGKTMLAMASAIEAAASGKWQVLHLSAEDDSGGLRERFNLYCNSHPGAEDCVGMLKAISVGCGQTPMTICHEIDAHLNLDINVPILIVLDSINTITTLGNRSYLDGLAAWGKWAMLARRISGGRVSFLINSETNKRGVAKGEALGFWSDVVLHLSKKTESIVDIELKKTRRTSGEGNLGRFIRSWQDQQFISELSVEAGLRAVK